MTARTRNYCAIEVPFDLRLMIRLEATEEQLNRATEHHRPPYTEWNQGPSNERIQRWLNQEVAPLLLKQIREFVPSNDLDTEAAWVSEVALAHSYVTEITYVADEAGLVD